MTKQTANAKTLILKWFDHSGQPAIMRGKLSSGIDRFLDEIVRRDSSSECTTVLLKNCAAARFHASGRDWRAIPTQEGLAVSTVGPDWRFGWHSVLRDEYVYSILSWLAYYARQYIHRSHVANALMIAWERDGVILHPFGSKLNIRPGVASILPRRALAKSVKETVIEWGQIEQAPCSRSRWTRRNTFEPAVHQAVFHFLRAQTLKSSGFNIEALAAFDCVLQSLQTIPWHSAIGDPLRKRSDLIATLCLRSSDQQLSEDVYFLRNQFAAHPGGWRWWDANELIDEDYMERTSNLMLRVLRRAADAEPASRRIDPVPHSWSNWLLESFPILFPAIWFPPKV